ncbi:hypothetical protein IAQ61_010142 [Plenodomus lingam]|uniref:uncharacterized protein n=1 Tax=Leptosphaeria maculans TaxID=5022 RepID=UPI003321C39C|nr:hypothetical protein IAQ61_010142 [Plenodomus lingam]
MLTSSIHAHNLWTSLECADTGRPKHTEIDGGVLDCDEGRRQVQAQYNSAKQHPPRLGPVLATPKTVVASALMMMMMMMMMLMMMTLQAFTRSHGRSRIISTSPGRHPDSLEYEHARPPCPHTPSTHDWPGWGWVVVSHVVLRQTPVRLSNPVKLSVKAWRT